jgi:hypothetical protein
LLTTVTPFRVQREHARTLETKSLQPILVRNNQMRDLPGFDAIHYRHEFWTRDIATSANFIDKFRALPSHGPALFAVRIAVLALTPNYCTHYQLNKCFSDC